MKKTFLALLLWSTPMLSYAQLLNGDDIRFTYQIVRFFSDYNGDEAVYVPPIPPIPQKEEHIIENEIFNVSTFPSQAIELYNCFKHSEESILNTEWADVYTGWPIYEVYAPLDIEVTNRYWENDSGDDCYWDGEELDGPRASHDSHFGHPRNIVAPSTIYEGQIGWSVTPQQGHITIGNTVRFRYHMAWNYLHGNTRQDPLDFGLLPANSSRSHHITRNLLDARPSGLGHLEGMKFTNTENNFSSDQPDIFYRFELQEATTVQIRTLNPQLQPGDHADTYLALWDEAGNFVSYSNDDNCSDLSRIQRTLQPGVYLLQLEISGDINQLEQSYLPAFDLEIRTGSAVQNLLLPEYGDGVWMANTYGINTNGDDYPFIGRFIIDGLNLHTENYFPRTEDPINVSGFSAVNCNDYQADWFSINFQRTNFPCGKYTFFIRDYDDGVGIEVDYDGDGIVDTSTPYYFVGNFDNEYNVGFTYELTPESKVTVEYIDVGGDGFLLMDVYKHELEFPTANGDQRFLSCTPLSPVSLEGGLPEDAVSAQWEQSTDLAAWQPVGMPNSLSYQPEALEQTTYFRLSATDLCGDTYYSDTLAKQRIQEPIDEYGTASWIGAMYEGDGQFIGRFASSDFLIHLDNWKGGAQAPISQIPGYDGCDPTSDNWQTTLRRTNWPCGDYAITLEEWEGDLALRIDENGDGIWDIERTAPCCTTETPITAEARLTSISQVEISFAGQGIPQGLALNFDRTGNGLQPGEISGDETLLFCETPQIISGTAGDAAGPFSYQWQDSTAMGAWQDIPDADGPDFQPANLSSPTWFRRAVVDTCGQRAYSNIVAKNWAQSPAPSNENGWLAMVFSGTDLERYAGSFSIPGQSLRLGEHLPSGWSSPSDIQGYTGCTISPDYWSIVFRKTGWRCANYDFHWIDLDDDARLLADTDGDGNWDYDSGLRTCCLSGGGLHDIIALNPNSVVEVQFKEYGGIAALNIEVSVSQEFIPQMNCRDAQIFLDENGLASITADLLDDGSDPYCGSLSLEADMLNFNCSHLGNNDVMLSGTNSAGNSAQCTANVTVADTTAP
ncbi:hypothetical protein FRY97_21030, partial [Phaeodactylibacter luteus]